MFHVYANVWPLSLPITNSISIPITKRNVAKHLPYAWCVKLFKSSIHSSPYDKCNHTLRVEHNKYTWIEFRQKSWKNQSFISNIKQKLFIFFQFDLVDIILEEYLPHSFEESFSFSFSSAIQNSFIRSKSNTINCILLFFAFLGKHKDVHNMPFTWGRDRERQGGVSCN